MGYTMLKNIADKTDSTACSLRACALAFIHDCCEGLRFDPAKAAAEKPEEGLYLGTALGPNQIPFNMQMDLDRLCLENALDRFLKTGQKEDAFDVYFCYLEMFIGDYEKTRRMIELLSEFEINGSGLLMKHRDHYSHSVYVFTLGLAMYQSNSIYRETYNKYYHMEDEHQAACHYLKYWGLTALFHDIGYPFELPFEQVASYFEVEGDKREQRPFVAYNQMSDFVQLRDSARAALKQAAPGFEGETIDQLYAYLLADKLGGAYSFTEEEMLNDLVNKPVHPDKFNYFMDHAYFSSVVLFNKLFEEMCCEMTPEHLDALTAILMHNSLYKFCIAHYKSPGNVPFRAELHPLAFMLMLCDELQCWDRTAYGRNSRKELHPMDCSFDFSDNQIKAVYLFDRKESDKVNAFKDAYIHWAMNPQGKAPKLKAYSSMYLKNEAGITDFQEDIERIVDLTEIRLSVDTAMKDNIRTGRERYLSDSNFVNLYHFAMVLNGQWGAAEQWKQARADGRELQFLGDPKNTEEFNNAFKALSLEYKLSNINQAKAFAKYMNEIGCFYTDKAVDFELVEHFQPAELQKIGILEHGRWLREHYDMGWTYGTPARADRELLRQHKDLIPDFTPGPAGLTDEQVLANYNRLDKGEQDKDTEPMTCMLALLRMFDGLRIYRL